MKSCLWFGNILQIYIQCLLNCVLACSSKTTWKYPNDWDVKFEFISLLHGVLLECDGHVLYFVTISCFVFSAKSSSDEMPNNPVESNLLGPGVVNSEPIAPIQIKTEVISPTKPAMKAEVISPTKLVIKTEATSPTKLTIKTEVISPTNPADIETFPSPSQPDQSFNSSITGTILGSEFFFTRWSKIFASPPNESAKYFF